MIYNLDLFTLVAKSLDGAIIVLSIIVFFDVLIKFKRPLSLKIIILLIVIFVCIMSIFKFYSNNEQEYFFIFAICKIGAILGLLNFFCLIYFLNFRIALQLRNIHLKQNLNYLQSKFATVLVPAIVTLPKLAGYLLMTG